MCFSFFYWAVVMCTMEWMWTNPICAEEVKNENMHNNDRIKGQPEEMTTAKKAIEYGGEEIIKLVIISRLDSSLTDEFTLHKTFSPNKCVVYGRQQFRRLTYERYGEIWRERERENLVHRLSAKWSISNLPIEPQIPLVSFVGITT